MKYCFCFLFFFFHLFSFGQDISNESAPYSSSEYSGNFKSSNGVSDFGIVVDENYILKPSDVIQVSIFLEPDLEKSVRIEADGTVTLPLIKKVKVADLTVSDAQELITQLYNRDYLVDPQISVLVVSFSPKLVRILGSVNRPGVVEMPPDRQMTLTEAIASANGINITEFDAQFDPAKQTAQLQDAIASGKYDGIVLCAIYGVGLIPDIEAAIAEGIEIVVLNQVVGADLTTSDPQVDGIAASVLAAPYRSGTRHGNLTVKACEGNDDCKVVFIYGIKGIPLDDAIRQGFDDVISNHSNIKVVAEGEGKYLGPDGGIAATQDILSSGKAFDVMVGADQSMQGAAIVLADEGMTGKVKLIGLGGSAPAIKGIADGSWFAGVFGAPGTEGRLAMEAMVDALNNGVDQGGIDPLSSIPDEGLMTAENISKFTAEWDG